MGFDYIVEGSIYVNGEFQPCCLGVEDGMITAVKRILTGASIKRFPKHIILPAGIDPHVHFRDPGFPQKETFQTGSTAAAFGGISCVCDMPNTRPLTISKQEILDKISNAKRKSLIDFGIYAGVTNENITKLPDFSSYVSGYKIFLGETTNALVFSPENLTSLFNMLKDTTKPVLFHAEDKTCLAKHKKLEKTLFDHDLSRPCHCEHLAISMILSHAPFPCKVHICHVSCEKSVQMLLEKKQMISFGVTPHHSLLHAEQKINHDRYPLFKVNPPLRTAVEQNRLFKRLVNGDIPILESDHAPHTANEKSQDFSSAPSGIIGVETIYPLFLYLASKQTISFSQTISMISESPAKLLGLKKGHIIPGYDADFITLDIKNPRKITSDHLHSKHTMTPFEGHYGLFPDNVYVRGHPIIEDGGLIARPGQGSFILSSQEGS